MRKRLQMLKKSQRIYIMKKKKEMLQRVKRPEGFRSCTDCKAS